MSTASPEQFKARLQAVYGFQDLFRTNGHEIWEALHGYYSGSVEEFYLHNQKALPPRGKALFGDLGLRKRSD